MTGNFIWRFHSPDENGPDTVHEQDFVPIEDLLAVRNSSGGAAGAARGEEEDGENCVAYLLCVVAFVWMLNTCVAIQVRTAVTMMRILTLAMRQR